MCWTKNASPLPPTPLVSDGTVKIFKVCKIRQENLCGYFYTSFNYILDKEYQTTIDVTYNEKRKTYTGTQGFHSYDASKCKVKLFEIGSIFGGIKRVSVGVVTCLDKSLYKITSYLLKDNYFKDESAYLIEGYLPKGTQYYVNEYGEIISDKIVLSKIIPTNSIKNSQYYLNNQS